MSIDGRTRILGLLGAPIGHSLSPRIQNHALRRLHENLVYLPFELSEEDLPGFLEIFPRMGGVGLNVTTPFKRRIGLLVRPGEEEVVATGSVNTVRFAGEEAIGHSTDGRGFVSWMRDSSIPVSEGGLVLLGFGATARSIAYNLGRLETTTVVTRRPDRAERIAERWIRKGWAGRPIRAIGWEDPIPHLAALVVGGLPEEIARSGRLAAWLASLAPDSVVVDLNYGAGRTPLRDQARDQGLTAHDGVGLLAHQAALSLSLWLGATVPAELLLEAVEAEEEDGAPRSEPDG